MTTDNNCQQSLIPSYVRTADSWETFEGPTDLSETRTTTKSNMQCTGDDQETARRERDGQRIPQRPPLPRCSKLPLAAGS